ncbi:MAG: hypothetical protein AAGA54_24790 [Myxococcota bacterium]
MIRAHGSNVCAEVYLNDIPVIPWFRCGETHAVRPRSVSRWLEPTGNTLEVFARHFSETGPRLSLDLEVFAENHTSSVLHWSVAKPGIDTTSFDTPTCRRMRLWQDATRLHYGGALRGRALTVAADIHRAFSAADFTAVAALQRYALLERARERAQPAPNLEHIAALYASMHDEGVRVRPFALGEFSVALHGRNRVVTVSRPFGQPAIVLEDEDGRAVTRLELHLAHVQGELRWVRS